MSNEEGIVICWSDVHLSNAWILIEVTEGGIVICFNSLHSEKNPSFIFWNKIFSSKITSSRDEHFAKAYLPIEFTEGRNILLINEHSWKEWSLIDVTVEGIDIFSNEIHP